MFGKLTRQLQDRRDLTGAQVAQAVAQLVAEEVPAEAKADFLSALARKGETVEELAGFVRELSAKSIRPELAPEVRGEEILDVCGTGGDRLNTFNISTTVALIASAAGIIVAKHGNRAVTSQSGSADVLEALGVPIDLTPEEAARSLKDHRFAFFFAPKCHPAFKHIAPARKICADRGQRTLFNFLGPLLNPVRPTAQLIGVPQPHWCEPIGRVQQALGIRRVMVVCGGVEDHRPPDLLRQATDHSYLDELSTLGRNFIAEFYQDRGFHTSTLDTDGFPLQPAHLADLKGGDRTTNARIVLEILRGEERGPKRDAVLLNAAAALFLGQQTRTLAEGWDVAAELIDNGRALSKLEEVATRRTW